MRIRQTRFPASPDDLVVKARTKSGPAWNGPIFKTTPVFPENTIGLIRMKPCEQDDWRKQSVGIRIGLEYRGRSYFLDYWLGVAGPDLYSIHYFRKVSDTPQAFDLLYEAEGIYCDMLCELFTGKTGIEIPPVEFGPTTITHPDQ